MKGLLFPLCLSWFYWDLAVLCLSLDHRTRCNGLAAFRWIQGVREVACMKALGQYQRGRCCLSGWLVSRLLYLRVFGSCSISCKLIYTLNMWQFGILRLLDVFVTQTEMSCCSLFFVSVLMIFDLIKCSFKHTEPCYHNIWIYTKFI